MLHAQAYTAGFIRDSVRLSICPQKKGFCHDTGLAVHAKVDFYIDFVSLDQWVNNTFFKLGLLFQL